MQTQSERIQENAKAYWPHNYRDDVERKGEKIGMGLYSHMFVCA